MKSMEDVQSTLLISNVEDNIVNHMLDKMHGNLDSYSERHKRNQASGETHLILLWVYLTKSYCS